MANWKNFNKNSKPKLKNFGRFIEKRNKNLEEAWNNWNKEDD